jgi:hypothetical protein
VPLTTCHVNKKAGLPKCFKNDAYFLQTNASALVVPGQTPGPLAEIHSLKKNGLQMIFFEKIF